MREPRPPANELARLSRLRSFGILDTVSEQAYDDITELAARICGVPVSLVSLVDDDRQWFKARHGLDAEQTPRNVSFCGHVVETSETLVVTDALSDPRFADNPLVLGEPKVRFYAGVPLQTDDGLVLGTLCVIDYEPRTLTKGQRDSLEALARLVMGQLSLRLEVRHRDELMQRAANAQQEAARAREHYDKFFKISLDLLCIAGTDGYFKELNPAWSKLLGHSDAELKAVPFIDFVHPDDRQSTVQEASKLGASGYEVVSFENRYRCSDGTVVWLQWSATSDTASGLLYAAARDITERKTVEVELRDARDRAENADRIKSQFLATMSHELRTPLNAIIGFSKLLHKNKRGDLQESDLKYLARVRDNGTHLLALINEVLDISKIESGQMSYRMEACDIYSLADGVLRLQESLASEKDLEITMEVPRDLDPFVGDRHRFQQVLMNLISNAVKFTESGSVKVRAITHADSQQVAAVEVVDTGIGISEDNLDKVFVAFEQVDGGASRTYAGTGLGLAISRSLCSGMGMELEAESVLGEGSVFRIVIPSRLSELSEAPEREFGGTEQEMPGTQAGGRRRVLVVDDNDDARQLIAEQLRELGCEVRLARDGAECLRVAKGWTPELITLDLMMPNANGWQVLASLRQLEELENVPVVVISMVADESRGTLSGALEILQKPVSRDHLARILNSIHGDRRRALVVEDNPDARMLLGGYLEEEGWDVAEAINGREGFVAMQSFEPDVVFLDLMMPVMDGAEFLENVRSTERYRHQKVVVVTAKELSPDDRGAILRRADMVLSKGASLTKDLEGALESLGFAHKSERTGVPG